MPARASDGFENSVVPSAPNKMEQERKRGERDNHEKQSLLRMSGRPSHGIDKSVTRPDPIRFGRQQREGFERGGLGGREPPPV